MSKNSALSFALVMIISGPLLAQKQAGFFSKLFKPKAEEVPEIRLSPELLAYQYDFDSTSYFDIDLDTYLNEEISDEIAGKELFFREYGVPVKVTDNLEIDSVWLALDDYYNIWDSRKVNPYDMDGEKFTDTLSVPLFDCYHDLGWSMPITDTYVTSPFGLRRSRWHYGTDLKLHIGDTVSSAFDGIVRMAQFDRYGYGHYVLVRHYNGLETLYGHLSKRKVIVGQEVKAGELIGLGGNTGRSTGSHLHFEVRYQGNAIDPSTMHNFDGDTLTSTNFEINPTTFSYLTEARKMRWYRIRSGDTLSHVAMWYGVPVRTLCRLNGISRRTLLRVGRKLRVN